MVYSLDDFVRDTVRDARSKHLAYLRDKYLLSRWFAEFSSQVPNDATVVAEGLTGQKITNIMVRALENTGDMEANDNAKLNTVLAVSDLPLGS